MGYDLHIGIDCSGAETPGSRLTALQVYATSGSDPEAVRTPVAAEGERRNWNRQELAAWFIGLVKTGRLFIAKIDHVIRSIPE